MYVSLYFTHCHLEEIAALQSNTDVFIIKEKSIIFTQWAWLQPIFNFKTSSTLIYSARPPQLSLDSVIMCESALWKSICCRLVIESVLVVEMWLKAGLQLEGESPRLI